MNSVWPGQTNEDQADSSAGESPQSEVPESEWDSPFAQAAPGREAEGEYDQEYEQEALAPDGSMSESEWESPFAESGVAGEEEEVIVAPGEFPGTCADVTMDGRNWPHGLRTRRAPTVGGSVSPLTLVPMAEVFEFQLSDYDVDRHELKRQHRDAIADLAKRIKSGIQARRYSGEVIRVFTYGEASSTAPAGHNAVLSRNRAFNALNAIRCAFKDAGIGQPVLYGFYGTGEQHARFRGPDNREDAKFRGVLVRAIAPLAAPKPCGGTPPPRTGAEAICVSVPNIGSRVATKLPPDIIPLGSIVPGLRLPIAIVTRAQATVRVEAPRSRQAGQLAFQGWGLEVALPSGRARIDIQADLRASLDVLARASASLAGKLRLGPLGLVLRLDASAFAQLIVKLTAQLRLRLDVGLGRPNIPDLSQCRLVEARGVRGGAFPFAALAGPALLIVPGQGYGPAVLSLRGPGVARLGLVTDTLLVPADKRTVRTLLALGGTLQPASAALREAEFEWPEAEWPEAFEEVQPELAPFA